jgi:hypothetical protein
MFDVCGRLKQEQTCVALNKGLVKWLLIGGSALRILAFLERTNDKRYNYTQLACESDETTGRAVLSNVWRHMFAVLMAT